MFSWRGWKIFWISSGFWAMVVALAGSQEIKAHAEEAVMHHPKGWKFPMPAGDSTQGRAVFEKFDCHSRYQINGENFPYPSDYDGFEPSQMGTLHPLEFFAESVIHPSASVSGEYRGADGRSPLSTEHLSRMTLRELIDLSSDPASLEPPSLGRTIGGEGRIVALVPEGGEIVLDHGLI